MSLIEKVAPTPAFADPMRFGMEMTDAGALPGAVAVPVKPTLEMLTAGARAGGVSVETAWTIYRAMLRQVE
ncbi:MAG TPA: hypothetical protein VEB20_05315 [Azospirillaceae bacterium]|nr:hypothetical protein [Azospirillaceae bacterium]